MAAKPLVPSSEKIGKAIGDAVRRKREALGISQEDFAELSDQHRTYVGAIERGERNPTIHTIAQIAAAFEQTPSQLLKDAGL
jgi:transcriptional regulator with XRE-family HTH domain